MSLLSDLRKIGDLRRKYTLQKEKILDKRAKSLQDRLRLAVIERIIDALDLDGDNIKTIAANMSAVSKIDRLYSNFVKEALFPEIRTYINELSELRTLNQRYFELASDQTLQDLSGKMNKNANLRIGLDEKGKIIKGGFLDSFINDPVLRNQIKKQVLNAVTGGVKKTDLIESVRNITVGKPGVDGGFQKYFRTFLSDTYSVYDAELSGGYAKQLGLDYAIYAGTEIETSRPFCIERKGKVFTREEIRKFGTPQDNYGGYTDKSKGMFAGKNDNYDPERDRGGHNCKDGYDWITYGLAIQLRPDLKK